MKIAELSKKKITYTIIISIALIIPCILAGMRADTIGTDVQVYVRPMFEAACSSNSFLQYKNTAWMTSWTYRYVNEVEIGFSLFVYIIAKIFRNINILLMGIEMLIIVPFYKGISYFKKEFPIWLCMLSFYLINYNVTLNMMRQWIAMAFLFYGFKYVVEKNIYKFIIIVLIAMSFHKTAIIGIIFYLLYEFIYSKKKESMEKNIRIIISPRIHICLKGIKKMKKIFFISVICCLSLIILPHAINLLNYIGLNQYIGYINGNLKLLVNQIIFRLPLIIFIILSWTKYSKKYDLAPMFLVLMVIDLIISQLGSITTNSWRIASYFSMFNSLTYCSICQFSEKRIVRMNIKILMIIYLIIYWIYQFVILGNHQTVPYLHV
ncbi:EpsG family protein [Clostridium botulinum]|uniref:EpsG family protein n=1 Tax=Clostridium botulinum TaxID=1491 RepID=UPI001C9AA459|nr:EpsG family protein [Clostridium botulinum]MBY6839005.1 EpsG family protein [Clostridium botulinum]